MGDISPVLASFLAGQQGRTDVLNKAQEQKFRQQQLDETIKQFQVESKRKQDELELQHNIFQDTHQLHLSNLIQKYKEGVQSGINPIDQTNIPGVQDQGAAATQQNQPSGVPGMPQGFGSVQPPNAPGTGVQGNIPVGQSMTADIPGVGPTTFGRPQTNAEMDVAKQQALAPGILKQEENIQRLAQETYRVGPGASKEALYAMQDSFHKAQLESQRNNYETRLLGVEQTNATRMAVAQAEIYKSLLMAGLAPGSMAPEAQMNLQGGFKLGEIPLDKSNPMHKTAINANIANGFNYFDPKIKGAVMSDATSANRLLNDFTELDNKYPAQPGMIGRAGNSASTMINALPLMSTEMGQAFNLNRANIAALAKGVGETPSMARSVFLAKKAEAAAIEANDTPTVRADKYLKLTDLALDKIQEGFSNLPQKQRIANWENLIKTDPHPLMQTLRKDARFSEVLSHILKTGNYDPSLVNRSK